MEMVDLEVVVPDSLYKRIESHAKAIGRTVPELVSLWLWDYEEQQRERVSAEIDCRSSTGVSAESDRRRDVVN